MIKKTYWTIVFLLIFGFSNAQVVVEGPSAIENLQSHEQCAHSNIHERMMEENEPYRIEQEQREVLLDQLTEQYREGLIPKSENIHTVPVVVHIIHDGDAYGSGSNITDEQVYSAVNALNQDFRKMAGTWGDGDGADVEVEFCLAQQDPSGNAHSGINRVNGCSVTDYCAEGITAGDGQGANEMTVKDLSRWPKTDYYNIWVVTEIENNNGGSGIQGYAYFPTSSNVDGIVILYNAFGTEGNLKSYTNRNKTLTHEMGHAFALFHTFQGASCSETNCAMQGDRVCDTPPTTLNSSCNSPACSGTQQIENYMDYTSQTCKNMFTEGQKTRMRLAIENSRPALISSTKCEPVVIEAADAGITAIYAPSGTSCESTVQPSVELTNIGTVPLANVNIQYQTSGAWENYSWTGLLGAGQSTDIILPEFDGGWGSQTLTVKTNLPNGGADANSGNDEMTAAYSAVQNGHEITVSITLDNLGGQTTWELRDASNSVLSSGGPYSNFSGGTVETSMICANDGCFDFIIYDSVNNGICCASGTGNYEVRDQNNTVLASGASFGASETTNFCLTGNGSPPTADFSANTTTVCAGNGITFTNETSGDVDTYAWQFFGGSPSTSSAVNPGAITYNTPGTYNVRLTATNGDGTDIELKNNYITVTNSQTWYADTDGDGHGDPNNTTASCSQPPGFVATADDCNDANGGDWNSCYDCLGVMNGPAVLDNCGTCDTNAGNDCVQDCAGTWGGNAYEDNCGTCDTNPANDCVQDCAGTWGGNAVLDNCGTCDTNAANDCVQDCAGTWGGNAVLDNCGTCDANPANDCEVDCAGTFGGSAYEDNCGVCDDIAANDCVQDCAGTWGGNAVEDNCGTCDTNPANDCVQDCAGTWGGNAVEDNCGTCDTNPANDCVQDCAGTWGGNAYEDNCGVCDAIAANDCVQDCAGIWGGNAAMDNCGICDTNPANDCVQDCAGIWGGNALLDNCGTCDSNPANDCVQDCEGTWGGTAYTDNCGICDDIAANDCVQDCAGTWGGDAYFDTCGTCDDNAANDCVPCEDLSVNLISSANLSCFEANDGAIEIEVVSTNPNYNISWNNGNDTASISELAAGSHQVTVTADDCVAFLEVTLSQPTELVADVINIVHNPCGETNIGAATITIAGGTEPYIVLVNGLNTTDFNMAGLIGDTYDVEISDANGCEVATSFEIEDLGCDELDNTQVIAFICDQEFTEMFDAVICDVVPNATTYVWELVNTTTTVAPIEFTTSTNQFIPADIVQIIPENIYEIRVKGVAFNAISDFGTVCTLRMSIGLSALTSSTCGNLNLTINSSINAILVEGADDYEFRFENQNTQERLYYYSGSSAVCDLAMVIDLELNTEYDVQVRARYRNIWGQYGDICEAKILSTIPTTSLDDESCDNNHINIENGVISVQQIQGASVYEIEFTESETGTKTTVQSNTVFFPTHLIGNLTLYTEYTAQARALINETWTPWGAECTIGFIEPSAPKLNMLVYPNPIVFGRDIKLQTKGNWKNMEIKLCTVMGKDIMKQHKDFLDATPQILRLPKLPTGMYLLHLSHGKQMLTKKILIQ